MMHALTINTARMKLDLSVRCQHQLTLTPEMKQSLYFLQLSADDIHKEVCMRMQHNPFLQIHEHGLPYEDRTQEIADTTADDLFASLREQITFLPLSSIDKEYLSLLLHGLDEAGYWLYSVEETQTLFQELQLTPEKGEAYLKQLHTLEPAGIGTRTLKERLLYQVRHCFATHPLADKAIQWLKSLTDDTESQTAWAVHAKTNHEIIAWLKSIVRQIPQPTGEDHTVYIEPDLRLIEHHRQWVVVPYDAPRYTFSLLSDYDKMQQNWSDALKQEWLSARLVLRHIDRRQQTLLLVARAIIAHQQAVFSQGWKALMPLSMKDIAQQLHLHESTISRVVHDKYLHTPQGILPLKSLFSHCVNAESSICSSIAIQALLKEYIDQENKDRPLSDTALALSMKEKGIHVARRTIAKYRVALAIPPSHLRRRTLPK